MIHSKLIKGLILLSIGSIIMYLIKFEGYYRIINILAAGIMGAGLGMIIHYFSKKYRPN